ncbi:replicative DNA helicase [Sandaracinobacter sp. RS1-74]|uniref:replicative DNA helicase n=1 Tax=Sandaracinobacteroides sayramensis TaxID=2913411 RepID=UPI001EDBD36D|nr:replicative DNA helicase [Sandaracinobacteroides sayramensis]MCG2842155.1 replicative DNA helicase [Sandaracinobacteroides sayramensis]
MTVLPHPSSIDPAGNGVQRIPFNIEAEKALLGALLLENRLLEDIHLQLRDEHFYEPLHGRVFAQIRRLADHNMVANPVTLRPLFETDAAIAELGGPTYLLRLTEDPAVVIAARDCAQQIYDLALLRALVLVGAELVSSATDTSSEVAPMKQIEAAEEALYRVAETGEVSGASVDFAGAARKAVEMAAKAMKSGGHLSGLTTGLTGLNNKIGGLHNSDLLVLAGRPAMGKTALATNIAFATAYRAKQDEREGISASSGAPVAFFSLEMSADQLANRILAEQSQISSENLRMGKITQAEFNDLARAAENLFDLPLYIDDTPALSIAALRTRARRLKRQKKIGLIVIDYLQLLQGTARNAAENRVQEISEITRGLKTLAKELDIPVIALSQLSRQVENREDKRPQLSDLRESGTIEQDADIVLFVFREEYYHEGKKPEDGSEKFQAWLEKADRLRGRAEVIVAKQRHGATGTVPLMFHREFTRFSDPAEGESWASDYGD